MSTPVGDEEREWLAEVGLRIRVARVRRRLRQDQLGDLAEVSRVTMGGIERGTHQSGVLAYVRVARALDLSLSELLDGMR